MLRFHGSWDKVTYEHVGYNSRLDELQAAILRVQLPHLDAWADGRRAAARHYDEAGLGELVDAAGAGRRRRARLAPLRGPQRARPTSSPPALKAAGHGQKAYYRTPVHLQPAMRELRRRRRAARDRRGGADAPRDPDEPGARRRAGGRGHRGGTRARPRGPMSAADQPLRVAVVGLGYWGPNLARNFAALPGASWPGAATPRRRCGARMAPVFPGARFTADLDEVLADDTLDAVVLATPVPTHAALAQRVLGGGQALLRGEADGAVGGRRRGGRRRGATPRIAC